MKRQLTKIRFNEEKVRVRLLMETEECAKDTPRSRFLKFEILRYIADDPGFSACGNQDFDTMNMYHDGFKWIVVCEAIVPKALA